MRNAGFDIQLKNKFLVSSTLLKICFSWHLGNKLSSVIEPSWKLSAWLRLFWKVVGDIEVVYHENCFVLATSSIILSIESYILMASYLVLIVFFLNIFILLNPSDAGAVLLVVTRKAKDFKKNSYSGRCHRQKKERKLFYGNKEKVSCSLKGFFFFSYFKVDLK